MEPLTITPALSVPAAELALRTLRSGGPGGQNVNKVETAVELRYDIAASRALDEAQRARLLEKLAPRLAGGAVLVVRSSTHREQRRNLEAARERMAHLLRGALAVPRKRRPTRPTRASQRRRVEGKKQRSETKRLRRRAPDG